MGCVNLLHTFCYYGLYQKVKNTLAKLPFNLLHDVSVSFRKLVVIS